MATDLETQLDAGLAQAREAIDPLLLSKVLFPETHTETVCINGKDRALRPVTLKYAKQISAKLQPFSDKCKSLLFTAGENKDVELNESLDESFIDALKQASLILCQFYDWKDVQAKIEADDLPLGELQGLCTVQTQLNGANDFLFSPLRLLIKTMQLQETVVVSFQNMLTSPLFSKPGTAALMS